MSEGHLGEKAQLDYVMARSHHRRRRVSWLIVAGAILLSGYLIFQQAKEPVTALYYQHECMNYSPGPQTVVYEEDHTKAAQLAKGMPMGLGFTTLAHGSAVLPAPGDIWAYFADAPFCLRDYLNVRGYYLMPLHFASPALFLHWRQARGGEERLIYVRTNNFFSLRCNTNDPSQLWQPSGSLDWVIVKPEGIRSPPKILVMGSWHDQRFQSHLPKPMTIYAGQSDPADDSHFTIRFRLPSGEGTIDGWLLNTDQLNFQATMPVASGTTRPQ